MDVKRVYFGNWLRDYSQAVDVGTVKYVSAEAIRLLLWVLGFMSFGYGTGEFEVTRDRLGCYRPEEHIDNPKDYADNIDARQYDRRLRAPVDERRELSIDERTGLKHYIATEDIGITTSAGMVKDLYARCIQLGRRYNQNGDKVRALNLVCFWRFVKSISDISMLSMLTKSPARLLRGAAITGNSQSLSRRLLGKFLLSSMPIPHFKLATKAAATDCSLWRSAGADCVI
jgi:hypothetical protein